MDVSLRLPNVSVRLVNVSVPHVDDSECPVFFTVCPIFGHGRLVNDSGSLIDDSVSLANVVDHEYRDVHEQDGDDNDADGYVHVGYRDVNVRYRDDNGTLGHVNGTHRDVNVRYRYVQPMDGDVEEGEGDDRQRGRVRRAATDSGPFRAGTISGGGWPRAARPGCSQREQHQCA